MGNVVPIRKLLEKHVSSTTLSSAEPKTCPSCGRTLAPVALMALGKTIYVTPTCQCVFEQQAKEQALREREAQKARIEHLFALAELGPRFQDCTFANWDPRPGTEAMHGVALRYAQEFDVRSDGLLFYGPPGNGKTHLAAAIVNHLVPQGVSCIFRSTPALLKAIERTNRPGSKIQDTDYLDALHEADLVVLDDLGAEKWTENREMTLYLIVDDRYRWKKPVIFTTNCDLKQLQEHIGGRTFDRLLEMCAGGLLENSGKSYRREQAAKRAASIRNYKKEASHGEKRPI